MQAAVESVPFLDLAREYRELEAEWHSAIQAAGKSGVFILGPNVTAFEQEFAAYVGARYAAAVASGTDALILSLRALDIGPGDEVITTPFTFFATAEAISLVGATPVFVDIEEGSFNIDAKAIASRITGRTRAVIPVHLYGYPAAMNEIMAIACDRDLAVIEDGAQACGAMVGDARVGSFGLSGCFSFYPTKVLGCYGDGGMITTSSASTLEQVKRLRNHGTYQPFLHGEIGYNSRLDEIQAALLRIKLRTIERDIAERQRVAAEYTERLAGIAITVPSQPGNGRHVFNLYTICVNNRDSVCQQLAEQKIATSVCYPRPLHLQQVYESLGYKAGDLPVCERLMHQTLSLPIYPGMPSRYIERVCEALRRAL